MTAYATRSPLQLLTNTYYMMAEQPSDERRTSARLKVKEDLFAAVGNEKPRQNGITKAKSSARPTAGRGAKRKLDYDEEDGGFKFSRAKAKRAKPQALEAETAAITDEAATETQPARQQKSRRKSNEAAIHAAEDRQHVSSPQKNTRLTRAQGADHSNDLSPRKRQARRTSPRPAIDEGDRPGAEDIQSNRPGVHEPTKIALPFADTPIIRRNKEMRKGNTESRRSSLSMRGRRASSLIDSGTSSALPHDQVETPDFYKHIESSLLEPRRMRQLLMWCGSRALGDEPSFATEDRPVKLAARQIQQELLKDFSAKAELSDWFSREDSPAQSRTLKPNPKNLAKLAKIEELELKLKALKTEHEQWTALQKSPLPDTIPIDALPAIDKLSLSSIPQTTITSTPGLQTLAQHKDSTAEALARNTQQRLRNVATSFELNLDKLLDSINHLGQHLSSAENLSKRVLSNVANVLDEKDKKVVQKEGSVGTRDTLRALTRVIDRG